MMNKLFKLILGLVLLILAAQLIKVDRTNPPVLADIPAPPQVKEILKRVCYDCHSNETVWPGYTEIAPISWLAAYDVNEGRSELNFSTWNLYDIQKRDKIKKEILEVIEEQEMPPWFYLVIHTDAILSSEDRALIRDWASKPSYDSDDIYESGM